MTSPTPISNFPEANIKLDGEEIEVSNIPRSLTIRECTRNSDLWSEGYRHSKRTLNGNRNYILMK